MFYVQDIAGYFIPGFVASIIFLLVYEIGLRIRNARVSLLHRGLILILGQYLTAVFSLTVSPVYGFSFLHLSGTVNLIPLEVLTTFFTNPRNLFGNILLFVPFGLLAVLLSNRCRRLRVTLLAGAGLSLFIELMQLFGTRGTDIDDVILNTAGTFFGYLCGRLLLSLAPSLQEKVGVAIKADGKFRIKQKDAGGIAVLAVFILISVFIRGTVLKTEKAQSPMAPMARSTIETSARTENTRAPISADISARNAYLLDIRSNTVLYEKESGQRIAPASTAKMLTALTALDYCGEDDEVAVGPEIGLIPEDASRAWLRSGDKLTVRQLLHALLLPSGNDAAYALAVFAGRKIQGDDRISIDKALAVFIKAMNQKAVELGAADSNFTDPDGYDSDGQYTTARDLACVAREFAESDLLFGIAGSFRLSDVWLNGREVTYYNTNELINPNSQYYYSHTVGLKTGSSEQAGYCLVSAAAMEDGLYLCVVMGSTDEGRWTDSLELYRAVEKQGIATAPRPVRH